MGAHDLKPLDKYISGYLEERKFATILSDLYYNKCSGYMEVSSDLKLVIYFYNGFVKYVSCDDPNLLIGKLLVSNNYLTKEQQERIIDFSDQQGIKFGEALIEKGWLTPHELSRILELQLKLKLLNGFRFRSGNYHFVESDNINPESDIIFNLHPLQIIYDAVDGNIFLEDYDLNDHEITGTLYPSLNFNKIREIHLSSNKQYKLIDLLRIPTPVQEILVKSPLDKPGSLKLLEFLKLVNFIRFDKQPVEIEFR